MDLSSSDLELGLPTWFKAYVVIFGIVWCGTLAIGSFVSFSEGVSVFALVPIIMLAYGLFMFWRMWGIGVRSSGDELVLRNSFSTRTVRRNDIEGFRFGQWMSPWHLVIFMMTRDQIQPLHVTMHAPFAGKRRAQRQLEELRVWHVGE